VLACVRGFIYKIDWHIPLLLLAETLRCLTAGAATALPQNNIGKCPKKWAYNTQLPFLSNQATLLRVDHFKRIPMELIAFPG
jgi:hypothetical protein